MSQRQRDTHRFCQKDILVPKALMSPLRSHECHIGVTARSPLVALLASQRSMRPHARAVSLAVATCLARDTKPCLSYAERTQVSDRVSRCWRQRVMMPPLAHALWQPIGSRKLGCADETEARICEGAATKALQRSYFDGSNQIRCSFIFRCPQPYLVGACRRSPQCGIDPCGLSVGTRRLLDP
jgi:hypothetical protein